MFCVVAHGPFPPRYASSQSVYQHITSIWKFKGIVFRQCTTATLHCISSADRSPHTPPAQSSPYAALLRRVQDSRFPAVFYTTLGCSHADTLVYGGEILPSLVSCISPVTAVQSVCLHRLHCTDLSARICQIT